MTTRTTHYDITDAQIEALADAAGWHADYQQVAICELALYGEISPGAIRQMGDEAHSAEDRARILSMTQDEARAECARVIAEAAALADR